MAPRALGRLHLQAGETERAKSTWAEVVRTGHEEAVARAERLLKELQSVEQEP